MSTMAMPRRMSREVTRERAATGDPTGETPVLTIRQMRIAKVRPGVDPRLSRSTSYQGAVSWMSKGAGMIDGLVPEKPVENGPRRGLRGLFQWLTGAPSSSDPNASVAGTSSQEAAPTRIGHY